MFLELIRHYGPSHIDYNNCLESRAKLLKVTKRLPSALRRSVITYFIMFLTFYNLFYFCCCRRTLCSSVSWREIWLALTLFMLLAESLYGKVVLPNFHREKVTNSACFFWQVEACFNIILFV